MPTAPDPLARQDGPRVYDSPAEDQAFARCDGGGGGLGGKRAAQPVLLPLIRSISPYPISWRVERDWSQYYSLCSEPRTKAESAPDRGAAQPSRGEGRGACTRTSRRGHARPPRLGPPQRPTESRHLPPQRPAESCERPAESCERPAKSCERPAKSCERPAESCERPAKSCAGTHQLHP